MFLASYDPFFSMKKEDRDAMIAAAINNPWAEYLFKRKKHRVLVYKLFSRPHYLILGGLIMGSSVLGMHYTGMVRRSTA